MKHHGKKLQQARAPVQNAESALTDPPDLQRPGFVVVSFLESRHPMQDEMLAHRVEQLRLGEKYDPCKDPPVQLGDLAPRLAIKVSAIFDTQDDADAYAVKLHAATDWNVVVVRAGVAQVFPPSESVSGKYKEDALNQYVTGFYERQRKGREDIAARVAADRAHADTPALPLVSDVSTTQLAPTIQSAADTK